MVPIFFLFFLGNILNEQLTFLSQQQVMPAQQHLMLQQYSVAELASLDAGTATQIIYSSASKINSVPVPVPSLL
jgi:hypothetical protein